MSDAKFTPGPWEVDPRVATRVRDSSDTTIASAGMASRDREDAIAEVEPFPEGRLILGRGSVIDAIQIHKLPREQK